ncbi:uncharacterized protein LAESUDRAFT_685689, partial [Laetiporus sulphureus 93-53]
MPRENSLSDSDGRSLTPDLDEAMLREAEARRLSAEPSDEVRPQLSDLDGVSAPSVLNPNMQNPTERAPARPDAAAMPAHTTAGDRFRAMVWKIIHMNRTASSMTFARPGVGAEPGVDPRRASANISYGNVRQRCVIEVVDYSTMRTNFRRMTNREFVKMLKDPDASSRDPWVRVRWINVGGISWDVLSSLALKYDMHPLAIEDVLTHRQHTGSKVDYYPQHLFLRVLFHSLASSNAPSPDVSFTDLSRSESPGRMDGILESDEESLADGVSGDENQEALNNLDDNRTIYDNAAGPNSSTRRASLKRRTARKSGRDEEDSVMEGQFAKLGSLFSDKKKVARNMKLVRELTRRDRINVKVHPICIFLFRDGTVISINEDPNVDFTKPITDRLRQPHTGLRQTADPSLLVQSLLDLIVDSALEVVEEYQGKLLKIEQEVLLKPSMATVRGLHILQGDLIQHKRTLEPIKTVIYGLRRYDDDRTAAVMEKVDPHMKVEGYMSHKAKIYLADVHDHMEHILTSLDMFAGVSENLINYTFNMASYQMNQVMRRLTLATIIFLPLTLLTGYFGMNFQNMWSVDHGHSDVMCVSVSARICFIFVFFASFFVPRHSIFILLCPPPFDCVLLVSLDCSLYLQILDHCIT